ncbi:YceI family protein [Frankia sp. CNm7]|uniref:YceI family protein n=1 Tax=Frankia nepalensis TaxID=1836974 RepID=A0A937RD48_9ACTN|nr:YceI family protein [Frankia nepalensis]MBL7499315.1 YceI family protein [Frankia nepalensis]MBL7512700.1 YceI family protein [Frankia nepalensis]MBL7517706.1 YceI family protein [Frankia nepalensis]MBL7629913.1 YceI family protein [Frankia nepalensis]
MTVPSPAAPAVDSLPLAPGSWKLDPKSSSVTFQVRYLGVSNFRGRFDEFDAALAVGATLDSVSVTASIEMTSINTAFADRDAHLHHADFLNAVGEPRIIFVSTSVTEGPEGYEATGDLTMNGVTRPVVLAVEYFGSETHPMDGSLRAGFAASAVILRSEFGIGFNIPIGVDKLALADKVKVELDLQFVAPTAS